MNIICQAYATEWKKAEKKLLLYQLGPQLQPLHIFVKDHENDAQQLLTEYRGPNTNINRCSNCATQTQTIENYILE